MKMKLYYVAEKAKGFYDEHDLDYVAGPFGSWEDARNHKNQRINPSDYYVVEQMIKVKDDV